MHDDYTEAVSSLWKQTAVDAAKAAGALLKEKHIAMHQKGVSLHIQEKGSALDLVTDADKASQDLIVKMLHQAFPEHRFLCEEEMGNLGNPSSPYQWIVDPLDGTTCFVHGRDNFGVILALQEHGKTILGVMYMPLRNQLFIGERGKGVTCNDAPLQLRKTKNLSDAILCSNTIRRAQMGADGIRRISTPPCASLENYGSALEEFALMLLGQNDGAFFDGIRLWDIAAGCMMMEELGGKSLYEFSEPENPRSGLLAVSSTAPIFDELKRLIFDEQLTKQ